MTKVVYPEVERMRVYFGSSKTRMAEVIGCDPITVTRKLNGESEFTLSEMCKIADWWGVSVAQLTKDREEEE